MNRIANRVILMIVASLWSNSVWAGPPTVYLSKKVIEVRALLAKPVEKGTDAAKAIDIELRAVISPFMEFQRLSENALRKHWPTLDDAQKSEFVSLFRALVLHSYLEQVRSAKEKYTIEYEDEEIKGPKAAAITAIARTDKAEIELVFHLIRRDQENWVVEDILIDEVSLVENYREQFNRIISKDGFVVLVQKMADKLTSIGGVIPNDVKSIKRQEKKPQNRDVKKVKKS